MTTTAAPLDRALGQVAEWVPVCTLRELPYERGVAALVQGVQIAIFRTHDERVYAVQQHDPYCGAMVISRGLVGTRSDRPTVASPMYKQVFDLGTGECLEPIGKEPITLHTWAIRIIADEVAVGIPASALGDGP